MMEPSLESIIAAASELSGVPMGLIKSADRRRDLIHIRAAIVEVAKSYQRPSFDRKKKVDCYSYPQIARSLGRKDHTALIHIRSRLDVYKKRAPWLAAFITELKQMVEESTDYYAHVLAAKLDYAQYIIDEEKALRRQLSELNAKIEQAMENRKARAANRAKSPIILEHFKEPKRTRDVRLTSDFETEAAVGDGHRTHCAMMRLGSARLLEAIQAAQ